MSLKVMELPERGIAVFDKGYNRYSCFEKWGSSNSYFVTRKKDKARYAITMDFDCSHAQDIIKDQLILLK